MKPLHDSARIKRVVVSTYQATSGAGVAGQADLEQGSRAALDGQPYTYDAFAHPIAFNVIPQIGSSKHEAYTSEEMKMVWETQKIFDDPSILVNPTCVRIPVFYGHSEAVHIETREKITAARARELLAEAPGVVVIDEHDDGGYPTPVVDSAGQDGVFVGRIREDISHPRGLDLWVVSDNVRKGAALNSVQIAECLLKDYL